MLEILSVIFLFTCQVHVARFLTPLAWKKRSKYFGMGIYIESTVKLLMILRDLYIVFQLLRNQFKRVL